MSKRSHVQRGGSLIEALEDRRLLSAGVTQTGSTLTILGDARPQIVKVFESDFGTIHQTQVFFDASGDGSFTGPGDVNGVVYNNITNLVVRLGGGANRLKVLLADSFIGAAHTYDISAGAGANTISFVDPLGNDISNSNVHLNIAAGQGNNTINLVLNRIASSTFKANITAGDGNNTVNLSGSSKVSDSTVGIKTNLGNGSNVMNQVLDWDGFGLLGSSTVWRVITQVGNGSDTLNATGMFGSSGAYVDGLLDIEYSGTGTDAINFALDRLNLRGGTLKLRGNGGGGNGTLALSGNVGAANGGGLIDIALSGGAGNDTLTSTANADPANHYAAPGGAILDGGLGFNTGSATGTLLATLVNIQA